MALPANRVNLCTNPNFETGSTTGWTVGANATFATSTTQKKYGTTSLKVTRSNTTVGSAYARFTATVVVGKTYTWSAWFYGGAGAANTYAIKTTVGGSSSTSFTPGAAWQRVSTTFTATGTSVNCYIVDDANAAPVSGTIYYVDGALIEQASSMGTYFDGDQPADNSYFYFWDATAGNSTSEAEYRGVWVEQTAGQPTVQVTVSGIGFTAGDVIVTRTADNETWTVPGWQDRNVVDSDTLLDPVPPLGRPVTYTCYLNGQQINLQTITVTSTTGYIQDPYDPSSLLPINTVLTDKGTLTLAAGSLMSRTHTSNASRAAVMGSARPYSISGQRVTEGGVTVTLNAFHNDLSDNLKDLISGAAVLLIRGLPSWGSLPGLMYTDGGVTETMVDRNRRTGNNALTQWTISGDLVHPVTRLPITGQITNDMVQTNLAGVTNDAIKARSGAKRNIDIKANPLSL